MDESATTAITAIADVRLESFIAASLHRLGWSVLYRATSIEGLHRAVSEYPQSLIVASDDFRGLSEVKISRKITLESTSSPESDLALHELIRNLEEPKNVQPRRLTLARSKIFLVASSGRTVGASTIALNLADELSSEALQPCFSIAICGIHTSQDISESMESVEKLVELPMAFQLERSSRVSRYRTWLLQWIPSKILLSISDS